MAIIENISFEVPELIGLIKGVDPAVFLVPPRVLRRVIRHDRKIGGIGLVVPHRKSYVIAREPLLTMVDMRELGAGPHDDIAPQVILLERPDADRLSRMSIEQALVKYWRMLFHGRVDAAMAQKIAEGSLDAKGVRQRIQALGATEFDEIAAVLEQEDFLLPPVTPESIYAEFVAVWWTLRLFSRGLLPVFFPALRDRKDLESLLEAEIDGHALFVATRPPGAPVPDALPPRVTEEDGVAHLPEALPMAAPLPVGDSTLRRLEGQAQNMDARGNSVRAAILRTRAAEGANLTLAGARAELCRLSQRLRNAMEMSDADAEKWRRTLLPLMSRASRGSWSHEARLLYDLQNVCVDSERGIFTVDLVEWALTLGSRPIRRELPGHQAVAVVRHLRKALDRLRFVRLANGDRQQLAALLEQAVEDQERLMRERFRPAIANAFREVGLAPLDIPEEIARNKLIEELLDRLVEYGHVNFGNLRDAISRNQLKLPDLANPVQHGRPDAGEEKQPSPSWLPTSPAAMFHAVILAAVWCGRLAVELCRGDPLLRLNRKLGIALDGVYRKGEIYMRVLHRLSSLSFGTRLGRLAVLFFILPFGLAFFTLVAPALLVEEGTKIGRMLGLGEQGALEGPGAVGDPFAIPFSEEEELPGAVAGQSKSASPATPSKHHGLEMPNLGLWAAMAGFYLLLFHAPPFRRALGQGFWRLGRTVRWLLMEIPAWLLARPVFRAILDSQAVRFFRRVMFRPLIFSGLAAALAFYLDPVPDAATICISGLVILAATAVLEFTRLGRAVEEVLTDWMMGLWKWGLADLVPAVVRFFIDLFKAVLEWVEQGLYVVDEWLRFQSGESFLTLALKAVLGVVWFAFTYIVRIYINLLIEPTVNPIKHFPVVTVGHKVMLPFLIVLYQFLRQQLDFLGPIFGNGFVVMTIFFLPGICGFVVWELKENWKLYRANRPATIRAIRVGSHGETVLRLLKPGFHSGTIPKLFGKMRRAKRRGQKRTVRKLEATLHHAEESVSHFVRREFLALLGKSDSWADLQIELSRVHLATNRISFELIGPHDSKQPLVLGIDQHDGWLLAGVLSTGWLPKLNGDQRDVLEVALIGLYKMAGIHLTREQVAKALAPIDAAVDIRGNSLVVWPRPDYSPEASYELTKTTPCQPQPLNGPIAPGLLPKLDPTEVLLTNLRLSWKDWVLTWDPDRRRKDSQRINMDYAVLP